MASIKFYLDRVSKFNPKSKEIRSVYFYATWKSKRVRKFTEEKVRECDWVPQIERLNPKLTGAEDVNKRLDKIESKFNQLFESYSYNPEPDDLVSDILQSKDNSFFALFEEFLKDSSTRINRQRNSVLSPASIKQYRAAMQFYKNFERDKKTVITFEKINSDFYSKIREYALNDKKYTVDTFGSRIKKLKTFLFWCQERDIQVSNKFQSFEVPEAYQEVEPISTETLLKLWKQKLNPQDQKYLDIFLALCSSGMRISDYNIVLTNMDKYIVKTRQGKALVFNAKKTGAACVVPMKDDLYFRLETLYKKYSGKMPYMPGQKLNYWLKESALIEGGESKKGRKTFCSIKYFELGMEAQYVMKMSGHKTESEFKKYVGVKADTILKENNDKSQFLKVS
jgi:hypothetical protein